MTTFRRIGAAIALAFVAVSTPGAIAIAAPTSYTTTAAGEPERITRTLPSSTIPAVGAAGPTRPATTSGIQPVGVPLGGAPQALRSTTDVTADPATGATPQPTAARSANCDPIPTGDGGMYYPCDSNGSTNGATTAAAAKADLNKLLATSCSNVPTGNQGGPLEGVLRDLSQPHVTIADRSYNLAVWIYTMGMTFSIGWFIIKVLPTLDHPTDAFRTGAFKALSLSVFMLLIQFAAGKGFFANNTDAQGRPGATAAQTLTAFSTRAANYIGQDPKNPIGRISSAGDAFAVFSCLADKVTTIPPLAIAAYSGQSKNAWWNPADLISSTLAVIPVTILSIIAGIVCDIVGVILAVNMFFLQWSALIIASASIFVLGLSSMEWTMPYANGYWRFVWSTMIGQFAVVLSTLIIMRLVESTEQTQIAQMAKDGTMFGIVPLGDILSIIFVLAFAAAIALGTPAIASAIASGEGSGLTPGKMALPLMALGGAGFFAASNLMKGLGALGKLAEGMKNSGASNAINEGKEKADAARNEIAGEQADTMPTGNSRVAAPDRSGTGPTNPVSATAARNTSRSMSGSEAPAPPESESHEPFGVNETDTEEAEFEMDEVLADAGRSARAEVQSAADAVKGASAKGASSTSSSGEAFTDATAGRGEGPQRGAAAGSANRAGNRRAPGRGPDATAAGDAVLAEGDALAAQIEAAIANGTGELNARAIYQSVAPTRSAPAAEASNQGDALQAGPLHQEQQARPQSSAIDAAAQSAASAPRAPDAADAAGRRTAKAEPGRAQTGGPGTSGRSRSGADATGKTTPQPVSRSTPADAGSVPTGQSGAAEAPPLGEAGTPPDPATARRVASAVSAASAARFAGATADAYASAIGGSVEQAMSHLASASITHAREVERASALIASASSDPKALTVGNSAMRSRATASRAIAKAAQSVSQMQGLATAPEQQQAVARAATSVVSAATNLATSGPSAQTYAALGAASDSVAQAVVSVGPVAAAAATGAVDNLALACSAMSTIAQESAPSLMPAGPPTSTRRFTTVRRSSPGGGGASSSSAANQPSAAPAPAAAAPAGEPSSPSIPPTLKSLESQFTPDESQSFRLGNGVPAAGADGGAEMAAEIRRQDLRQRREILRQRITGLGQRALDAIAHDQHISGVAPDARHLGNTKH